MCREVKLYTSGERKKIDFQCQIALSRHLGSCSFRRSVLTLCVMHLDFSLPVLTKCQIIMFFYYILYCIKQIGVGVEGRN